MDAQNKQSEGLQNTTHQSQREIPARKDGTRQELSRKVIAVSFVIQAILIGVEGNMRVLSGESLLTVIPSMVTQGIELIVKAAKESKSKSRSDRYSNRQGG